MEPASATGPSVWAMSRPNVLQVLVPRQPEAEAMLRLVDAFEQPHQSASDLILGQMRLRFSSVGEVLGTVPITNGAA